MNNSVFWAIIRNLPSQPGFHQQISVFRVKPVLCSTVLQMRKLSCRAFNCLHHTRRPGNNQEVPVCYSSQYISGFDALFISKRLYWLLHLSTLLIWCPFLSSWFFTMAQETAGAHSTTTTRSKWISRTGTSGSARRGSATPSCWTPARRWLPWSQTGYRMIWPNYKH